MQDAKGASKWSVKTTNENVRDRGSKHYRAIPIFAFFFILLCLSFLILSNANLFYVQTNVDSARYMLSALVQSRAAILAIVISLTLIAIQLSASAYSPRVIKIFKESLGWLLLFVFYGVSIFYGLLVLKMIKSVDEAHPTVLSTITYLKIPLAGHISLAYAFGCLTFIILVIYLRRIINLLNPATLINRLAEDITKDKILEYLKSVENDEEVKNSTFEDPIQPIMDIVHGSIMKYDIATTRVGLRAVTDRVIELIDSDNDKKISKLFCNHLERVGRLAISRDEEESAVKVIEQLEKFGKSTAEKKLSEATRLAVTSLGMIGEAAAEKGFEVAAIQAAISLEKVGVASAEKILKDATEIAVESLFLIGGIAVEKDFEDATGHVVTALGNVGIIAAKNGLNEATLKATSSLLMIGIQATKKKFEVVRSEVADYLAQLTILSEKVVENVIAGVKDLVSPGEQRDLFSKIMDLYTLELVKLRAEQQK
jgi:hypothetical protein